MSRSKLLKNLLLIAGCLILAYFLYQKAKPDQAAEIVEGLTSAHLEPIGPKYSEPVFVFEEILTIEADPSEPGSMLMYPTDIDLDNDGYIYIADSGDIQKIVVFTPEGTYERSFGGYGSGPGEFQNLSITSVDNGVVHLFDPNLHRMTRYSCSGRFIDVTALRTGGTDRAILLPDLNQVLTIRRIRGRGNNRNEEDSFFVRAKVTILDSGQTEIISIESNPVRYMAFNKKDRSVQALYFAPFPNVAFSQQYGFVMTTGAQPVVNQYDRSGYLSRKIMLDLPLEPVTQADRTRTTEYVKARLANVRNPEPGRYENRELLFAEQQAYWRDIRIDEYGYIWLKRFWDFDVLDQGLGTTCYVIHPNGEWLGTCYLPNASGSFFNGKYVTFITDEESGEKIPTIFNIRASVEGLTYPN